MAYGCRRDSLANEDSNGIRATKIFQRPRSSRLDRHANDADDGWLREFRYRLPKESNNRRQPIDRGADRPVDDWGCTYHCPGARGACRAAWAYNGSRHFISNGVQSYAAWCPHLNAPVVFAFRHPIRELIDRPLMIQR